MFYEYVMLSGVNDGEEQAHQLGQLLKVCVGGGGGQGRRRGHGETEVRADMGTREVGGKRLRSHVALCAT